MLTGYSFLKIRLHPLSPYIFIYRETISQLFKVARHARCFKLESKPESRKVSQLSCTRATIILCVSERMFYVYFFTYILSAPANTQFMARAIAIHLMRKPANSSLECSIHGVGIECSPMVHEIEVQSQVVSYQRFKKWYLIIHWLALKDRDQC